jgi:transcriptional regulator with XRE-family HTH domain
MTPMALALSTDLSASATARPIGDLLRQWRQRRRLSQMALALDAEISPKHLSFVESGRARPSREMVLRLGEQLALPLREQNQLLLSAGYAPIFQQRPLGHPDLQMAYKAVQLILNGHEPFPALAIDRHWNMVAANQSVLLFMGEVAESLRTPSVSTSSVGTPSVGTPSINVLRLSLHPLGLAPRIVNLTQWRAHIFARLQQQINLTGDPVLIDLLRELRSFPERDAAPAAARYDHEFNSPVMPLLLKSGDQVLSFLTTTMVFGTPIDVTLSELAIETFFPADAETNQYLQALGAGLARSFETTVTAG